MVYNQLFLLNIYSDAQDAEGYEVVDRILLSKLPPPPWFSTTSLSSPISPSNNIRQRAKTLPYNKVGKKGKQEPSLSEA